jgi:hypothetical protein
MEKSGPFFNFCNFQKAAKSNKKKLQLVKIRQSSHPGGG